MNTVNRTIRRVRRNDSRNEAIGQGFSEFLLDGRQGFRQTLVGLGHLTDSSGKLSRLNPTRGQGHRGLGQKRALGPGIGENSLRCEKVKSAGRRRMRSRLGNDVKGLDEGERRGVGSTASV